MNVPPALKPVQPYITLVKQFAVRDPVVSYFCKMYAVEMGIGAAKGDHEAKLYIIQLMDELKKEKHRLKDDERYIDVMVHDDVAQTHIETVALKLFEIADGLDRAAQFNKSLIKMYFTASYLFSVLKLSQFGEMSEEMETKMKYAKWKAVEIDRCLKNGITPTPGPPTGNDDDEFGGMVGEMGGVSVQDQPPPQIGFGAEYDSQRPHGVPPGAAAVLPPPPSAVEQRPTPAPRSNPPSPATRYTPQPAPAPAAVSSVPAAIPQAAGSSIPLTGFAKLSSEQITQAQKYCRFAASSLDYNDTNSAAKFMEKALRLLRTGRED